jgi:hypothetical protein
MCQYGGVTTENTTSCVFSPKKGYSEVPMKIPMSEELTSSRACHLLPVQRYIVPPSISTLPAKLVSAELKIPYGPLVTSAGASPGKPKVSIVTKNVSEGVFVRVYEKLLSTEVSSFVSDCR